MSTQTSKPPAKRSWLSDTLAQAAISTGIGYYAVAYTVSRWLTRPAPGKPKQTPEDLGIAAERFACKTSDRIRITGWSLTPKQPRGTVVVCHGLRQNRTHTLNRCALLANNGYRAVGFDHRAHGESGGKRSSFGFHEARDVSAVIDFVRERWPNEPVGALGMSMGAAALCFASDRVKNCKAVVLEGCYFDLHTAFANRLRHGYPAWFQKLTRGVIWMTERRLGVRIDQLNPAKAIADLAPVPLLLMTGTADPLATPEETQRLYERAGGPKEVWYVPNASHRDVFEVGGDAYRERVLDFLDRRLAG